MRAQHPEGNLPLSRTVKPDFTMLSPWSLRVKCISVLCECSFIDSMIAIMTSWVICKNISLLNTEVLYNIVSQTISIWWTGCKLNPHPVWISRVWCHNKATQRHWHCIELKTIKIGHKFPSGPGKKSLSHSSREACPRRARHIFNVFLHSGPIHVLYCAFLN